MRDFRNHAIVLLSLSTAALGFLVWQKPSQVDFDKQSQLAKSSIAETRRSTWEAQKTDTETKTEIADSPSEATNNDRVRPGSLREVAMLKLMEDPEYVRLTTIQQKAHLDPRYAALFRKLGLTAEMLESFKNLLVERQSALIDTFAAARSQGVDPRQDRQLFRELDQTTQTEIDESIHGILGESAYATFRDYEQTLPYRNLTEQLEARLSYSPSPLTDAQTEQLIKILASDAQPGNPGSPESTVRNSRTGVSGLFGGQGPTITAENLQRSAGILTPDQQTVLQEIQSEQVAAQKLQDMTRSSFNSQRTFTPVK